MQSEKMKGDWAPVLADVPLFEGLSKRHLRRIAKLAVTRRIPSHVNVVRDGARGDAFFVILDGSALVKRPGKRGIPLGAGDAFGELALLDDAPRMATVQTQEATLCLQLSRTAFTKMLEAEPKVSISLLQTLARRLREAERGRVV